MKVDHFVFGGLAIMVTCVTVDPLALRPRLSPSLPLSNDKMMKRYLLTKTKSPGVSQARRAQLCCGYCFGGLAIVVTSVTLDPLALRPRLSPGLPLSVRLFNCSAPLS
jgi:hypothetical protein